MFMSTKVLASPIQNSHWKQITENSSDVEREQLSIASISAISHSKLNAQQAEVFLSAFTKHYGILRTGYETDELGVLWQNIRLEIAVEFIEHDWSELTPEQVEKNKRSVLDTERKDCLLSSKLKVVFAQLTHETWVYLELTSLNVDVFSLNYLIGALIEAGSGNLSQKLEQLGEDIIQYVDLSPWLTDFLLDDELAEAREFWSQEKTKAAENSRLSIQRHMESLEVGYDFLSIEFGNEIETLSRFASENESTIAEVVCASLRMTLARFNEDARLVRVFDSRADDALISAFGPLSRSVPLFTELTANFVDAIKKERECTEQGQDYSECFDGSSAIRDGGFAFVFEAVDTNRNNTAFIERIAYISAAFKLQFLLIVQGRETRLQIGYAKTYINEETVELLLRYIQKDLTANLCGTHNISTERYIQHGELLELDDNTIVLDLLDRAVKASTAIVKEVNGASATLEDINTNANRFANYLVSIGVGQGDSVALCLSRSIDFVTSMLAVMKAGAAYVPIDIGLPAQRINSMLDDAQCKASISKGASFGNCRSIDYNALDFSAYEPTAPEHNITGSDLAYILFTSGSSGKAKGVSISHRSLLNHMVWINQEFLFNAQDSFLQRTSASFDASVWEFWSPLLVGATMIIAPVEMNYDVSLFKKIASDFNITRMQVVPSLLDVLLEEIESNFSHKLKTVFCGGEALSTATANNAQNLLGCEIVNLYGPSECCIDSTYWRFSDKLTTEYVPIGFPINNLVCRVVRTDGQLALIGEEGELQIAGYSVFNGYHNQPELTANALITCQESNKTFYRTGDNVRVLADGNLMFIERFDDQVKLNGFRIELDEISMSAKQTKLVENAKCVFDKSTHSLTLFVIKPKVSVEEVEQQLKITLPEYMIPQQIIDIEKFPYLPNGKINKRALVERSQEYRNAGYVPPTTEIETKLVEIWQELLGTTLTIGIEHDFFLIGGHSLLAMKAVNRIIEQFKTSINVRVLFEHKTISELAAYIEALMLLSHVDSKNEEVEEMEGGLL